VSPSRSSASGHNGGGTYHDKRQASRRASNRGMGGLGEAICIKLAALGHTVVTTFSPGNTKSAEWLSSMKQQGLDFKAYPCDVADHESAAACVKKVTQEVGPVDVLVNNAGITRDMTFKKMDKPN
jgi:acetoacetyl-CoA reductase